LAAAADTAARAALAARLLSDSAPAADDATSVYVPRPPTGFPAEVRIDDTGPYLTVGYAGPTTQARARGRVLVSVQAVHRG
jgi:hypothetical protein